MKAYTLNECRGEDGEGSEGTHIRRRRMSGMGKDEFNRQGAGGSARIYWARLRAVPGEWKEENMKAANKRRIKNILLFAVIFTCIVCMSAWGAEEDWTCTNCNSVNAAENNFCGNCGSPRPAGNAVWICPECGKENDGEFHFCVNCGAKKSSGEQKETGAAAGSGAGPYAYGQHMVYWDGYTYVTGDDGIYRIDGSNQFERILGIDSVANGIFAVGKKVYFMKEGVGDFLYVYDMELEDCEVLYAAGDGSLLIGADDRAAYFLQPSGQSDYTGGKDLIRYHFGEEEAETVASGIGTAQFWNGGIVISGAASDVSPVELAVLGADGTSGLVGENCSQSFYIDGDRLYYIKYKMTSDTAWDGAYICCLDETGNREFFLIDGEYATPYIVGEVSGNIVVSFYEDGRAQYIQINPEDGSWGEMELPEGAKAVSIFYDENGNRYYYANSSVYVWKGSEYRKVADVATDGTVLGVAGNYVFCWRYNEGDHPSLFQYPIENGR